MAKTIAMSAKTEVKVRNYIIKRMPLGQFLRGLEIIKGAPTEFMEAIFPGKEINEVIQLLKGINSDLLSSLIVQALGVVPNLAIKLFAELSGIEEDKLLNDPNIGLDGLMELINAWIEINGIAVFTKGAKELIATAKAVLGSSQKQNTGSKDLSPQP